MSLSVTNSGRARPLPPKGINVNSSIVTESGDKSQTSTCSDPFGKFAPRKNLSDAGGDWQKSLPTPTGKEVRHA